MSIGEGQTHGEKAPMISQAMSIAVSMNLQVQTDKLEIDAYANSSYNIVR